MGISIEVNASNFNQDVVEASYERPVFVDFFAQWCGPCQMLKPVLEKLSQEYNFVLAKVDIDQNPELAHAYQVEGVPDVRIVANGQMHPGFVGMLPEPKLRELMNQLDLRSTLDEALAQVQATIAAGDTALAKQQLAQLMEQYPQNGKLAMTIAQVLVQQNDMETAIKLLDSVPSSDREFYRKAKLLQDLLKLTQKYPLQSHENSTENPLDSQFAQAIDQAVYGKYESALNGLLEIVSRDRKYRDDGARKTMILIFDLLGDEHPLAKQYRRQLTLTLY